MVRFKCHLLLYAVFAVLLTVPLAGCANMGETGVNAADAAEIADFMARVGYTDAVYAGGSAKGIAFLACGTNGRLDRIYADGSFETIPLQANGNHLTSLLAAENKILVGGLDGTLLSSQDGASFQAATGVGNEHILGLTAFGGRYFAVTFSGAILSSEDGVAWQPAAKPTDQPLISVAADKTGIIAVTTDSDIVKSTDGVTWTCQNYNEAYRGLAASQAFTKILNQEDSFILLGSALDTPEIPTVLFSYDFGESWSSGTLAEINARPPEDFYPISVHDVQFYAGELLAACNKGRMLTFTDCPTCNLMTDAETPADLRTMALYEDTLLIAGDDFHYEVIAAEKLRQNNISPEQAQIEIAYGAVVIDVRTAEEYAAEHISGSLHIPVEELESKLAAAVPEKDQTILFYCVSGKKSQTALEKALQLGYQNVFNLGGLSDWPYETD